MPSTATGWSSPGLTKAASGSEAIAQSLRRRRERLESRDPTVPESL